MKTRTDLLNHLIQKHGLNSYLEIGLQDASQNFDKIQLDNHFKISVDPDPNAKATFCVTSDTFFLWPHKKKFDIVFIDGLHTAEQVKKDFENALQVLSPNGFIVLHDLLPETYERQLVPRPTPSGSWNGDCWKFGIQLAAASTFKTVNIDNGCGVWNSNHRPNIIDLELSWEEFNKSKNSYLNVISWEEFIKL